VVRHDAAGAGLIRARHLVDRLKRSRQKLSTFTDADVRKLLAHVDGDRLGHAWHLALSGLRRGELCGLRWSDVDLVAGTVTIAHNRVSMNGQAIDSQPKTDRSAHVLPLTPALTTALRRQACRIRQGGSQHRVDAR
jgi:integrase